MALWQHFDGSILAIGLLLPLLFLQHQLHTELMYVFVLLTRRVNIALVLYTLVFFPGVLLHEISHWLMAGMLRVPTGRMTLIPEWTNDGKLRMGSVEVVSTNPIKDSLIGVAPLLFGGAFVGVVGVVRLDIANLLDLFLQDSSLFWPALQGLVQQPDFWLWFYLLFAVSSTMFPSESDRQAWMPVMVFTGLLVALLLLFGAGPWLLANIAPPFNTFMLVVSSVFAISVGVHVLLLIPVMLIRRVLNRITGLSFA